MCPQNLIPLLIEKLLTSKSALHASVYGSTENGLDIEILYRSHININAEVDISPFPVPFDSWLIFFSCSYIQIRVFCAEILVRNSYV